MEHLIVGNFGEISKAFKKFIAETAISAGSDAFNMTLAYWTDVEKNDVVRVMKKRFKVALGCAATFSSVRYNSLDIQGMVLMPPRVYRNSWFNNRENNEAYNMFRSYNYDHFQHDNVDDGFEF